MKVNQIIRAWKDEDYRSTLSQPVPQNPAGQIELNDSDLRRVTGGQDADTCICSTKIVDSCVKPPVSCP